MRVVAVVGGAVAGSEAAALCAERGILTLVLDQNLRPYGKIEDGLPRWHAALRLREYERIDRNLSQPRVLYLPRTRLGRDVDLDELLDHWGVQAVFLAHGAWRDRPLTIPDAKCYVGRGLVYQNELVHRFNHAPESGETPELADGAVVVGGGLASIDVAKILNLERACTLLRRRGLDADLLAMERDGIPAALARHGLRAETIGFRGCTLFYRRRRRDMPLAEPLDGGEDALRKTETIRERILGKASQKYLFRVEDRHVPVAPVTEGEQLVGLRFRRTELVDGRLTELPGTERMVRAPLVVGSIGSLPEPLPGVPTAGELYRWADPARGALAERPGVFGLGNVLTGRGNIKASRDNARWVAERALAETLGDLAARPPLSGPSLAALFRRVRERWAAVGYPGRYPEWIARHPPLERRPC